MKESAVPLHAYTRGPQSIALFAGWCVRGKGAGHRNRQRPYKAAKGEEPPAKGLGQMQAFIAQLSFTPWPRGSLINTV